jgi:hypothetical protein
MVRPHRFSSTEYVLASEEMGIPQVRAISSDSSRDRAVSRTGAITSRSGPSAANVVSNRTWSFPLPVHPWATARAPVSRARLTTSAAIRGRANAEMSGYFPS